jgi:hypothetical protein
MVSCRVFKLDSSGFPGFEKLLSRLQREHQIPYGRIEDSEETDPSLNLYFDGQDPNDLGRQLNFEFDKQVLLRARGGYRKARITVPSPVEVFHSELSPLAAVFCSRPNTVDFASAINTACGPGNPFFMPVRLDLTGKSEQIRSRFKEVLLFKTERLQDDMEKSASVSGIQLESSDGWRKYVNDLGGQLTVIRVRVNGAIIQIGDDASFRFRATDDDVQFTAQMIRRLRTIGFPF